LLTIEFSIRLLHKGAISMESGRRDCLHCTILQDVGRGLENGEIDERGALDDVILVMVEILATAPIEDADEMMSAVEQDLSESEVRARQRNVRDSAIALKGGRRRGIARQDLTPERDSRTRRF
jgi:hypothetical protein